MNEALWVHTATGKAPQWIRDHASYQGDDCIPWPFFCDPGVGRGRITATGIRSFWSHRVMCEYVKGPPPTPEHHAAHNCGNGHMACMNQKHLEWKTGSDNALDRAKHGTNRSRPSKRKLTLEQVEEIRRQKGVETQMALAARFGVSDNAIRNIHAGRTWNPDQKEHIFTADEIREIRRRGPFEKFARLATEFGTNANSIRRIVKGETYRHVA